MKFLVLVLVALLATALYAQSNKAQDGTYYCFNYQRRCQGEVLADDGTDDVYKIPEYLYKGELQKIEDGYLLAYIYNKGENATGNDTKPDDDGGYSKRRVLHDDDRKLACTPYEIGCSYNYDAYKSIVDNTEDNYEIKLGLHEYAFKYGYWQQSIYHYPTGYSDTYNYASIEYRFYYYSQYDLIRIRDGDDKCHGTNTSQYLPTDYAALEDKCEEHAGVKYWKNANNDKVNHTIVYGVYDAKPTYLGISFTQEYLEYVKTLGDDGNEAIYYEWDVEQPEDYGDLKWYPQKYGIYYVPACEQHIVKLYDWKKL